jgi:hypothetical protein
MSIKQVLKAGIWGMVFTGAGILSFFLFARNTTLTCERGPKDQISCVKSEDLMGVLNFKDVHIPSLENAWVSESCDDDGCTYRVELEAARGNFHLTSYSSSGYRSKEKTADQINTFIHSSSEQTLEIEASTGLLGIILPSVFILAGLVLTFSQVRNAIYKGEMP